MSVQKPPFTAHYRSDIFGAHCVLAPRGVSIEQHLETQAKLNNTRADYAARRTKPAELACGVQS